MSRKRNAASGVEDGTDGEAKSETLHLYRIGLTHISYNPSRMVHQSRLHPALVRRGVVEPRAGSGVARGWA